MALKEENKIEEESKMDQEDKIEKENKKENKKEKIKQKEDSKKNFSRSEMILLVIMSLMIGLSIGLLFSKTNIVTKEEKITDSNLKEFIENYEYIINNYYEEVDKDKLIDSAIEGMMESLDDPYSMYFDEDETSNFSISLDGSYQGVGIQIIQEENGYMLITVVFKNSPASEAGLKAGDEIISIDEKESKDMSASDFSDYVRNSENETYSLKILRDEEELDIILKKSIVTLDSVSSNTFDVSGKKVGYIYIGIFASNTLQQFSSKLSELEKENIEYLIIDVRQNTGGHLTAVDGILDLFLNSSQIMYQFEQNEKRTSIYGTGKEQKEYEIILLGDGASASASEVLIAGLRENLNSKFIGKKTYGKGTVQELVNLSDGTQYKITVKKWLTPKGNWINDTEGITPDIEVELDEKYYQTGNDEDDTQLQAALDYIKEKQN